jgi:putative copper resistance protein D
MMDAVWLLQVGSAFLLNAGFAWLVGSWFARRWMGGAAGLRRADLIAAGLCVTNSAAALLAATAVMAGVGLREACPMFWMMVTSTAYGQAGAITIVVMLALFLIRWFGVSEWGAAIGLMVFAITRASMGHAGEEGLLSVVLAAEAIHYIAIGVWTGTVLVSAWAALNDAEPAGGHDRYLGLMSQTAMLAVIAIFATGLYSAWHRVGTFDHLQHTDYGITLLLKVSLVLIAVGLGGYNKFAGLPAVSHSGSGLRLVRTILRVESVVLLAALLAASLLTSQQPPAGAMPGPLALVRQGQIR